MRKEAEQKVEQSQKFMKMCAKAVPEFYMYLNFKTTPICTQTMDFAGSRLYR
jgi:hypothetical protein